MNILGGNSGDIFMITRIARLRAIRPTSVVPTDPLVTALAASGDLRISGLPYRADATTSIRGQGNGSFRGITFANRTQFNPFNIQNSDQIGIRASGSGVDDGNVTAAQVPSGGSLRLEMSGWYIRRQ